MTIPAKGPLPQPAIAWLFAQGRQDLAQYLTKTDALLNAIAAGNVGTLVNAANDVAAQRAGVAVGQLYRNGSQINVRVV